MKCEKLCQGFGDGMNKNEPLKDKVIDNRHYFEDALLTWKILETINTAHSLKLEKVFKHIRISIFEVDAIAICKTLNEYKERWIGFELKENDIEKAFTQAYLRRNYFDYFYIVIDLRVSTIVKWLLKQKDVGEIGFVSAYENILVLPSKFKPRKKPETEILIENKNMVDKKIVKLVDFLQTKQNQWDLD